MRLLLLRHGATPGNLKKQYIGATDQPLAPLGVEQAKARVKELPAVERVWASSMLRAVQTAELFYPGVPRQEMDGLREMDFGIGEEKTWEEINDPSIYDGWMAGSPEAHFPGGETLGKFAERTTAALREIASQVKAEKISTGAIVAHGGVLMVLMSLYGRPARESYFHWESENCGGFDTEFDPDTLVLTVRAQIGKGKIW